LLIQIRSSIRPSSLLHGDLLRLLSN
jgi:hypothetical protein